MQCGKYIMTVELPFNNLKGNYISPKCKKFLILSNLTALKGWIK